MTTRRRIGAGLIAAGCVAVTAWLGGPAMAGGPTIGGAASAPPNYDSLRGTQWYVPAGTLPAAQMNLANGQVTALSDQTVWDITGSDHGYFWGRTVAVIKPWGSNAPGTASCSRMFGSATPDGRVHITFVGADQKTTAGAVRGIGIFDTSDPSGARFEMQMSTGTTSVVAHWSYMYQCKSGQACRTKLPGSNLSLSQFLAQCP